MKELENLAAFRARTGGFICGSLPRGGFETNGNLPLKVSSGG